MAVKHLTILGSTGSIGTSTLDIVEKFPDAFRVMALSCRNRVQELAQQIEQFHPQWVCVGTEDQAQWLQQKIPYDDVTIVHGDDGLVQIAAEAPANLVVAGIVGAAGLRSTYAAIESGRDVALANKETMVLAGELIVAKAETSGSHILPMDSEHNAIFQSLVGHQAKDIEKIILTASGGPFRDRPYSEFPNITLEEALNHPNWEMGPKITIDSATMMNKGLEVIEARWLFDLPVSQIDVMIHRESIIHSMVEYCDGSFIAQLGLPDMRTPIAYCLSYPNRLPLPIPKLNLTKLGKLHFEKVSAEKFPCLQLAIRAANLGGAAPAVLNGANEAIVAEFLEGKLPFIEIAKALGRTLEHFCYLQSANEAAHSYLKKIESIDDALAADRWGRQTAISLLK